MVSTPDGLSSRCGEGLFHWSQLKSFVTPSHESSYLADPALPCALSRQSSCISVYLSAAVFSSQENYHVLEYLKCSIAQTDGWFLTHISSLLFTSRQSQSGPGMDEKDMPVGCQHGCAQCLIKSTVAGKTDINNTGWVIVLIEIYNVSCIQLKAW